MNFQVRNATLDDLAELKRLRQERMDVYLKAEGRLVAAEETWFSAIQASLEDERATLQVADREGQLIGYMLAWVWQNPPMLSPEKMGLVTEMSVDGHCKQGGVGTAMLASVVEWFKSQELSHFEIRVPRQHPIEQAFWRAMGAEIFVDHFYYRLGE